LLTQLPSKFIAGVDWLILKGSLWLPFFMPAIAIYRSAGQQMLALLQHSTNPEE